MKSTLTELIDTLGSSLHSYLAAAGVWTFPGDEAIKLALVDLEDDGYALTPKGGELARQFAKLDHWAEEWAREVLR